MSEILIIQIISTLILREEAQVKTILVLFFHSNICKSCKVTLFSGTFAEQPWVTESQQQVKLLGTKPRAAATML